MGRMDEQWLEDQERQANDDAALAEHHHMMMLMHEAEEQAAENVRKLNRIARITYEWDASWTHGEAALLAIKTILRGEEKHK